MHPMQPFMMGLQESSLELVQKQEASGTVSFLQFDDLDGNRDKVYFIFGEWITVTSGLVGLRLRPNLVNTAQDGQINAANQSSFLTADQTEMVVAQHDYLSQLHTITVFSGILFADSGPAGTDYPRIYRGMAGSAEASGDAAVESVAGVWTPTGDVNLTQFGFNTSVASEIGAGTNIRIYRLPGLFT